MRSRLNYFILLYYYNMIVNSGIPSGIPTVIHRAVKDFAESEERAKNLLVFGLKEEEGEEVISETIGEVFEALGEKPTST